MDEKQTLLDRILDEITTAFTRQWKVFLLSLVVQLIIVVLLNLGMRAPEAWHFMSLSEVQQNVSRLMSPEGAKTDIFASVMLKLEQKPNNIQLKKDSSLVPSVYAATDYDQAKSYVVVDLDTGKILAAKDSKQEVPIASLTKVMSAMVALDLAAPDELFTVTPQAANMEPTKIGVVAGQQMKLTELLNASLLSSANDAMQVIADGVNQKYGQDIFVRAMNQKAAFLGLTNTHFTNPQGLDNGHPYSSASDFAVLSAYALRNYPQIADIVGKDYQFLPADSNHKQFDLYNWNGLLDVYPGTYGLKIGNTDDAGFTTAVAAERDGHRILVVLLGAPGVLQRDLWAGELLDAGFAKFNLTPVNVTQDQLQTKYATWKYWQ